MNSEKKTKQLSIRVTESLFGFLDQTSTSHRRRISEVGLALLERGIAAYHRDGLLFEPPPGTGKIIHTDPDGTSYVKVPAPEIKLTPRPRKKNR